MPPTKRHPRRRGEGSVRGGDVPSAIKEKAPHLAVEDLQKGGRALSSAVPRPQILTRPGPSGKHGLTGPAGPSTARIWIESAGVPLRDRRQSLLEAAACR